jgi:hypothetical protein
MIATKLQEIETLKDLPMVSEFGTFDLFKKGVIKELPSCYDSEVMR